MKLVQNSGSDRVVALLLPHLKPASRLGRATLSFSLYIFAELRTSLSKLEPMHLALPADDAQLGVQSRIGDRAHRNQLQSRSLASKFARRLGQKIEMRRAHGRVSQDTAAIEVQTAVACCSATVWRLASGEENLLCGATTST